MRAGRPRVYYAKTQVPSANQAFHADRRADGTWAETALLPGVPVERLAVVQRSGVDHVYLASPSTRQLFYQRR
jgi:hypothetical protein